MKKLKAHGDINRIRLIGSTLRCCCTRESNEGTDGTETLSPGKEGSRLLDEYFGLVAHVR